MNDKAPPTITTEIQELRAIRDYLLSELLALCNADNGKEDWEAAAQAIDRVRARIRECENGWQPSAWTWPQRRADG